MSKTPNILYCNCAYARIIEKKVKDEVLEKLCESGVAFDSVADLCEMSARKDPALKRIARGKNIRIAACYPRAVKWLFAAADVPLDEENYQVLNMRVEDPEQVVAGLLNEEPNEEEIKS